MSAPPCAEQVADQSDLGPMVQRGFASTGTGKDGTLTPSATTGSGGEGYATGADPAGRGSGGWVGFDIGADK
ncbi:hypothetical protein ACIQZB_41860 [Streptomyces sp. NPDC097727]|uniref:hypothetical protein n=1 Tax=Streptomyces sp. NPDC097727 TaxID=3366092 RepID=UPI00381BD078